MRAPLLLLLALTATPLASAQTERDSTTTPEAAVQASGDTLTASGPEAEPKRFARFAFPTDGGVFYFRAGSGSAIRRRTPSGAPAVLRPGTVPTTPAARPLAVSTPARAPEASAVRSQTPARPGQAASGVTQSDLDRLEARILAAMDRRLDALDRERVAATPEVRDRETAQDRETVRAREAEPTPRTTVVVVPPVSGETEPEPPVREAERNPAPEAVPEAVPPVATPPVVTVEEIERDILDTGLFRTTFVNFEFARAELLPISERTLDALVTVLLRYPALRIEIGGHTDNVGTDATNDALSQRRAESVAAYLVSQGVARQRLSSVGYGEARPVATNESETGRALNRRVEFVVLNPEDAERVRR